MTNFVNDKGVGNHSYTQVGPLITVEKLKETYLFGKTYFTNEVGEKISDETIQEFINYAVSLVEHDLDIAVMPRTKVEFKDYNANDYMEWGYFTLNNYPVLEIESFRVVYMKNALEFEQVLEIPAEWIRLDPESGIIRLIPSSRFPGRLAIGSGGAFFPELFNRSSMVPHMWEITYKHGFEPGCVPKLVNSVIGMLAAVSTLNVLGDLIIGAGVAAQAISMDGLSQSISATSSAENNGFSGAVIELSRLLYGDKSRGYPGQIQVLRNYYKGRSLTIV